MNVTALARQLKVTTQEFLEKLPELGFDIGARAIKVDDKLAPKIVSAWKRAAKRAAMQEEMAKVTQIRGEDKDGAKDAQKEITIPETIVVKDMAELMSLPVARLMGELMKNGIMVSLNEKIDLNIPFFGGKVKIHKRGFLASIIILASLAILNLYCRENFIIKIFDKYMN